MTVRVARREILCAPPNNLNSMAESDRPHRESEDDEPEHPLKAGIDAAEEGDTAALEDILSHLD